jgi:hypothetical protein
MVTPLQTGRIGSSGPEAGRARTMTANHDGTPAGAGATVELVPFFDDYPRFVESSLTGHSLSRLNARYTALIHENRARLKDATVLDLASHDGRFSFAALQAGARRVVGIEIDPRLVAAAHENFDAYNVDPDRYEFVQRDMFEHFDDLEEFDVVLCFGILYHITDHMQLLGNIAGMEPQWLIVDTHVSFHDGAVVELRSRRGESPPPPGSDLEGYPSRAALDAMLASFGWETQYFDWHSSGLIEAGGLDDYRSGRRVSAVVRGTERIPDETRDYAVALVRAYQPERRYEWMAIKGAAEKFEVNPYALRMWVRKAERETPYRPAPDA